MSDYKPGDIANGHILSNSGQWLPVSGAASTPPQSGPGPRPAPGPSLAMKIGMGVVWIGVVGWFFIGSVILGLALGLAAPDIGQGIVLAPIAGIGVGIWLHLQWLARAKAKAVQSQA
ncbi:hypothetical protein [uncultured Phycicoccus sp.]|uniref:hypothetical protein n=1 Tax=uncultured Phycicoccus sp. TaxID=661422 RepID=UPI002610AC3E|nr:hypothetical protein [uncultured Phycicoccus sp.]